MKYRKPAITRETVHDFAILIRFEKYEYYLLEGAAE
jgi:hypothetical protein